MAANMGKIFKGLSLIATAIVLVVIFITPACKKDTDCKAIITVTDSLNAPVAGAAVHVGSSTTPPANQKKIEQDGTTDGSGKVSFIFKLEATFEITATRGTETGTGIIMLKPGETVEKTVQIN